VEATWTTPEQAGKITRETLTEDDLLAATAVIELYTGATPDDPPKNLSAFDLRCLKKAEAYQAAWMAKQVEYTGRSDVDDVYQDGMRFTKGNADTHTLAPLARTAIKRLSWRRGRTVEALTPEQALVLRGKRTARTIGVMHDGLLLHDHDDWEWEPM
jgi:hypothetical protein